MNGDHLSDEDDSFCEPELQDRATVRAPFYVVGVAGYVRAICLYPGADDDAGHERLLGRGKVYC